MNQFQFLKIGCYFLLLFYLVHYFALMFLRRIWMHLFSFSCVDWKTLNSKPASGIPLLATKSVSCYWNRSGKEVIKTCVSLYEIENYWVLLSVTETFRVSLVFIRNIQRMLLVLRHFFFTADYVEIYRGSIQFHRKLLSTFDRDLLIVIAFLKISSTTLDFIETIIGSFIFCRNFLFFIVNVSWVLFAFISWEFVGVFFYYEKVVTHFTNFYKSLFNFYKIISSAIILLFDLLKMFYSLWICKNTSKKLDKGVDVLQMRIKLLTLRKNISKNTKRSRKFCNILVFSTYMT